MGWTAQQKDAMDAKGGSVLVSAAAGSGKTAVLVERVIRKITDPISPVDANRFLIVTFTSAAAAEMKERISAQLTNLITEDPTNENLRRQKILLEQATISTIHSFCMDVLRDNFHRIDLPADFKIIDTSESDILLEDSINEIIDEMYEDQARAKFLDFAEFAENSTLQSAQNDVFLDASNVNSYSDFEKESDFFSLVELVSSQQGDTSLVELIKGLFKKISSAPFPEKWLEEKVVGYDPEIPFDETLWAKFLIDDIRASVNYCKKINDLALNELSHLLSTCGDDKEIKAINSLQGLFTVHDSVLERLIECKTWEDFCKNAPPTKTSELGGRFTALPGHYNFKYIRDTQIKIFESINKDILIADSEDYRKDCEQSLPLLQTLFELIKRSAKRFSEKKLEKNGLDFSDLEHYLINLLIEPTKDGYKKKDLAFEISQCYEEILIDEYQDTSPCQDMIFLAVSNDEKNLFMVGDIKQSIYRFRQAKPDLFIKKYNEFAKYGEGVFPAKITLSKNFRSRESVTENVNFFFSQLMSSDVGKVEYDDDQKLFFGAEMPDATGTEAELLLISNENYSSTTSEYEAYIIASKIQNMTKSGYQVFDKKTKSMRNASYKDFAVLTRSATKGSHSIHDDFIKVFSAMGIPAYSSKTDNLFQAKEISQMLSLLGVIDNPTQDIALMGVMLSPIFGFTADDLARLRCSDRHSALYLLVKKGAQEGDKKCADFLEKIERWRTLSVTVTAQELICLIYQETGFLEIAMAMPNGEMCVANLRLLLNYADKFERSGYQGLSDFIRLIYKMRSQDAALPQAVTISENADVVRIMTMHASKGLEFPVCFISRLGSSFNDVDYKLAAFFDENLGIGLKKKKSIENDRGYTLQSRAIISNSKYQSRAEELRLLYVAMTRAREKLILTAHIDSLENSLVKNAQSIQNQTSIPPYLVLKANGFSDWLIMCALRHPDGENLRRYAVDAFNAANESRSKKKDCIPLIDFEIHSHRALQPLKIEIITQDMLDEDSFTADIDFPAPDDDLKNELAERITYKYPYSGLDKIPTKVTASAFSHSDGGDIFMARPKFISSQGDFSDESGTSQHNLTPAEKGTALHKYMQFADFKTARINPEKELERLVTQKYISKAEGKSINLDKVREFFTGDFAYKLDNADEILREIRFSVDLPVNMYDNTVNINEFITLQGVADCVIIGNNRLCVIDYKTDRVKEVNELALRYRKQIELYRFAMEKLYNMPVSECILYSFHLSDYISVEF